MILPLGFCGEVGDDMGMTAPGVVGLRTVCVGAAGLFGVEGEVDVTGLLPAMVGDPVDPSVPVGLGAVETGVGISYFCI